MTADRGVLAAAALHTEGAGVGARVLLRLLLRVGRVRHLTRHGHRNSASLTRSYANNDANAPNLRMKLLSVNYDKSSLRCSNHLTTFGTH